MILPFDAWLADQVGRNDHVGELARDVRKDPHWPSTGKISRRRLHDHLASQGAIDGAIAALDEAWDEWDAERRAGRM